MKDNFKCIPLALLLCILVAGCASQGKYDRGYAYPFMATGADLGITYYSIAGKPDSEDPDPFDFMYSPWCLPLYIVDLPFSIVTDIVTLPYDLYHWKDIGKEKEEPQPEN